MNDAGIDLVEVADRGQNARVGFELRVLGPLEVVADGAAIPLPGRKHVRLLAALALADGHACSMDALADAVWGETPPPSARKLLQLYVSQLRKVLPEGAVRTSESGYALDVDGASIDAVRFERLAQEAATALAGENPALAASLAERALALWRGPAYADVMYEDFARADAERLEELRLGVIEDRLDAQLRLGRHETVLPDVLALAAQHALRERLQGLAMLTLYRSGRQTEALDRYADFRRRLDDELGLEPGPQLRDLQQRILRQDPDLDRPSSSAGPNELAPGSPEPARRPRRASWRSFATSSHAGTRGSSFSPAPAAAARRGSHSKRLTKRHPPSQTAP